MRPPSTMSDAEIDQLRLSQNETPGLASATRVRPVAVQTLGRNVRTSSRLSETPSSAPKVARMSEISMGPPPPKLPELNQLKAKVPENEGSLGGEDMFKNIRGE